MAPEQEENQILIKVQKMLLERYLPAIVEKETKTVGEIKQLINKNDLTIQSLIQSFEIAGYSFPEKYAQGAEKAFNFARDQIKNFDHDLGFSFWFSFNDIMSLRVADDEDKAIFLCSLLYALGDEKAEVVIAELESGIPHAFVATQIDGRYFILDPFQNHSFLDFSGDLSGSLGKYSYNGSAIKKFLYKFNRENYEQFAEND